MSRRATDADRHRRLRVHRHDPLVRAPSPGRGRAGRRRGDVDVRRRPGAGCSRRGAARHRAGTRSRRAARWRRCGLDLHVDRRAPGGRRSCGRGAGSPCSARSRSRRRCRSASASPPCSARCRTRSAWCSVPRPCSARSPMPSPVAGTARPWPRCCATTSTSRTRECTAPTGGPTSHEPAAGRSSSTRSTTSTCCAGCSAIPSRSRRGSRPASAIPGSTTPRRSRSATRTGPPPRS